MDEWIKNLWGFTDEEYKNLQEGDLDEYEVDLRD